MTSKKKRAIPINKDRNAVIIAAAETSSGCAPGTLIGHSAMSQLLSTPYGSAEYYGTVEKLRRQLRAVYGIFLQTEHNEGYRTVKPGEEITQCKKVFTKGVRFMGKGVKQTYQIDVNKIPEKQRQAVLSEANTMNTLYSMTKQGIRRLTAATR